MNLLYIYFLFFALTLRIDAQELRCSSLANGCSDGATHDTVLRNALARFSPGQIYGGGKDSIIFSSFQDGDTLAQVAYSCMDGSTPPELDGSSVQSQ